MHLSEGSYHFFLRVVMANRWPSEFTGWAGIMDRSQNISLHFIYITFHLHYITFAFKDHATSARNA